MRMEGRESGPYGVVIEVSRKTREGGRLQRVASNRSRKNRRPWENCRFMLRTRAQELEARDRIEEGGDVAKKRKKRNKSCKRDEGNERDSGGNKKNVDKKVFAP